MKFVIHALYENLLEPNLWLIRCHFFLVVVTKKFLITKFDCTNNRISFSQNVHDESLPTSIQTMSCKLLLNLVECIKGRSEKENCINSLSKRLKSANNRFFFLEMHNIYPL